MSKYLEELYCQYNERNFNRPIHNRALQKAVNTFSRCEELLIKRLQGKNLKLFIKSVDAADEMTANIAVESFVNGARVGAKLMLEIVNDVE